MCANSVKMDLHKKQIKNKDTKKLIAMCKINFKIDE